MVTPRPLVLVGAGGFARETAELVAAINAASPTWQLRGFVDDNPAMHGTVVGGHPVLGPIDSVVDRDDAVVVCVGHPGNYASRARIVARLGLDAARYATLVHPAASLAPSTTVGHGSVIHAMSVATCDVTIGDHVAVMPAVIFTHDDRVDDYVTIGAGVRFAGGVHVGSGAYVGSGALVRENRSIGSGALIGMGSVVTSDIPAHEVWAGVVARYLRPAPGAGDNTPTTSPGEPRVHE